MADGESALFNGQIANSSLQNSPFHRIFAHFSACGIRNRRMGKIQTPHAALTNFACGVWNPSTRRHQIRRFAATFSPLYRVCNN
jgi:hypothetical protein